MTETVVRRELDRWQWMCKVNEKLTFLILNANNNKDITEEDWQLLDMLYRDYESGVFPIYESVMDVKEQSVTEIGLFADNPSVTTTQTTDGKDFVDTDSETKTEEEND